MNLPVYESLQAEMERHRRTSQLPADRYCDNPTFPRRMMVEVTNACNHRCYFCANTRMTRPGTMLSLPLYERVIREAADLGVREVSLYSTGEPLLHRDFVAMVIQAKRVGVEHVSTTTNGVLLDETMARACFNAGIDAVRISINGGDAASYRETHGFDHFERVLANLHTAHRIRQELGSAVRLRVSCVVTRRTEVTAELLGDRLHGVVDEVVFLPVGPQAGLMRDISQADQPEQFISRHPGSTYTVPDVYIPCAYPFDRVHLTADGFLSLCPLDFDGSLRSADVRQNSLIDAWQSEQFSALRRQHLEDRLDGLQCHSCVHGVATTRPDKVSRSGDTRLD